MKPFIINSGHKANCRCGCRWRSVFREFAYSDTSGLPGASELSEWCRARGMYIHSPDPLHAWDQQGRHGVRWTDPGTSKANGHLCPHPPPSPMCTTHTRAHARTPSCLALSRMNTRHIPDDLTPHACPYDSSWIQIAGTSRPTGTCHCGSRSA